MSHIYYKEQIKVFPATFHPLIPTLFLEAGKMPCSSNDKTKSCIILINLAGIYFLRPNKLQKGYKVSKFLSSFLITEVSYDPNKRIINTKSESLFIQCPHMDEAIVQLVSARKFLLSKFYDRNPVKFNGFPTNPVIETFQFNNTKLLALQYLCYCAQHDEKPDENGILLLFEKLNTLHHSILGLDAYCRAPNHLNCLCGPVHLLDSVTTLFFSGFAPYSACRIIHKIIRHQFTVRNFILDSYKELVPEQLRLKKLSPKSVISIAIQNSRLPEEQMVRLFNEFGEFSGEIQRLTLKNIELTDKSWNELLVSMTTCKSFRTIEVFELEKIDTCCLSESQVKEGIEKIMRRCRFIQKFSFSMSPLSIPFSDIRPFMVGTFLYELSLRGQNLSEPLPDTFRLPHMMIFLDLSHCIFTYTSLKSLFLCLSKTPHHTPLSLNLSDIDIPITQWNQFYPEMERIAKPTFISELDWSGNPIKANHIESFVSFFFTSCPIKYLAIDRIFGTNTMDDFKKFFSLVPKGKLKGLSVGGSAENNFLGGIPQFFDVISTLCPLNILHLIGQKIKVNDLHSLFQFLTANSSNLWEIFIDDTDLQNPLDFINFYKRLFGLSIPIMGRPEIDLERLFGPKNVIDQGTRDELEKFKAMISTLPDVASPLCRSYFFSRPKGFELKDYSFVLSKFPLVFFDSSYIDRYQIQYRFMKSLPSLIPNMAKNKASIRSLSDLQATTLVEPTKAPRYDCPDAHGNTLDLMNYLSSSAAKENKVQQGPISQQNVTQDSQFQQNVTQDSQFQQNVTQDSQFQQNVTQDSQFQQNVTQDSQFQQNVTQDSQFQQNVTQDSQFQQNATQDGQYQQNVNQDGQFQQNVNQDGQYQQYPADGQYQQYEGQDQYQQYSGQDQSQQFVGDGQYQQYQQYGEQDQFQQYPADGHYQQYGSQDQFQQYPADGQYQQYEGQDQYQQYSGQDQSQQFVGDGQYQQYQQYGNQDQFQQYPADGQFQQYVDDGQYQQYGNQDQYQQYQSDGQFQQYGNQDQFQQYPADGQFQQYVDDGQYQQYGNQDQYQQYQSDGQFQQYGNQDQYQQYQPDGQFQQFAGDGQFQQFGNLPLDNQSNAVFVPDSSIDLMFSQENSNQQFFQPEQTANQEGWQTPNDTTGTQPSS
ncbi:hypothetical protein M9Y10_016153 [Tritrichomonas musculus]|uniref:Uncharacterized protein n=1 Tax=Tritrichomonas musculus TaxID=1915356 RepID=A0ABR2I5K6_9EUKA